MSDPLDNVGFGYSLQGRRAAWKTPEEWPPPGPNCPVTYELLELARERLVDPQRIEWLNLHIDGCPHCSPRYAAQCRAVEQLAAARAAAGVTMGLGAALVQRRLQTSVQQVIFALALNGDGPEKDHATHVELYAPKAGIFVPGSLLWHQKCGFDNAAQWHVALSFPRPGNDPKRVGAWSECQDRQVELAFTGDKEAFLLALNEDLFLKDENTLGTLPKPLAVAPPAVKAVRLSPGPRRSSIE